MDSHDDHERLVELAALVDQMRMAQREYFKAKRNLSECLTLERRVDAMVRDILNPRPERRDLPGQMSLDFGGGV